MSEEQIEFLNLRKVEDANEWIKIYRTKNALMRNFEKDKRNLGLKKIFTSRTNDYIVVKDGLNIYYRTLDDFDKMWGLRYKGWTYYDS